MEDSTHTAGSSRAVLPSAQTDSRSITAPFLLVWTHLHVFIARLPRLQSQTQPKLARKINLYTIPKSHRKGGLRGRVADPDMSRGPAGAQTKGVIGKSHRMMGTGPEDTWPESVHARTKRQHSDGPVYITSVCKGHLTLR